MTFKKYFVLEPTFFNHLVTKAGEVESTCRSKKDSGHGNLDILLQRILQDGQLSPLTKWTMYSKLLNRYKPTLASISESTEAEDLEGLSPVKTPTTVKRKDVEGTQSTVAKKVKRTYNRKPKTKELSTQTSFSEQANLTPSINSLPSEHPKYQETIFLHTPESKITKKERDDNEIREFKDQSLEDFMYELAQAESGQNDPRKLIRRESNINSTTRVFDDLETGAVIHIDSDLAREKLYGQEEEQEAPKLVKPKKKKETKKKESVPKLKLKLPNWEKL